MFTETNSEGKPVVKMTDEQRYTFDLKGWLPVKGLLSKDEIDEMVAFAYELKENKESVPERDRSTIGGPLEKLTDHPVVVGLMQEFVGDAHVESDEGYGFRMEFSFMGLRYRKFAHDHWGPHGGKGPQVWTRPESGTCHRYTSSPGKAFAGLVQVVWELTDVIHGHGTHFISGTHKACFDIPDSVKAGPEHPLWETYECPAGSLVFFAEATTHSGSAWKNPDHDRVAIFNSYNSISSRYHYWDPHPDQLAAMPPKRRSLFRKVCYEWNKVGMEHLPPQEELDAQARGF
ncbi:MAG: hypothetical protein QF473_15065 [Planctomycetota bacterium]|nr:hypothetical protein [Planctomycetota bacterium]